MCLRARVCVWYVLGVLRYKVIRSFISSNSDVWKKDTLCSVLCLLIFCSIFSLRISFRVSLVVDEYKHRSLVFWLFYCDNFPKFMSMIIKSRIKTPKSIWDDFHFGIKIYYSLANWEEVGLLKERWTKESCSCVSAAPPKDVPQRRNKQEKIHF